MKLHFYIILSLVLVLNYSASSQTGNPFIINYPSKKFLGSDQNFNITQDSIGQIYVANRNGVYVYDGKYWTGIVIKNAGSAKSLYTATSGMIYVGGEKEFGYISAQKNGKLVYKSLTHLLSQKDKENFQIIWTIKEINNVIYFCSNEIIFCYRNQTITCLYHENEGFHTFFKTTNLLIVREKSVGLKILNGATAKFIKGSEPLKNIKMYSLLPITNSKFMLGTRNGLYILHKTNSNFDSCLIEKKENEFSKWCVENEIYCGEKLNDNKFVFGSIKNGLVVTDSNFTITSRINTSNGLLDDNVKSIYLDYNNNLWAGLNSGLAMCELNSPITFWNKQDGINGVIESVTKHQNNLYAATDKGLIKLNSTTNKFEKTELSEQIYDLKTYRKSLLIATRNNLYIKNGDANPSILLDKTVYYIYIDTINNYLYLSCDDAILCCTLSNNSFSIIKQYNIPGISRSITKNKEGFIIIGNETDGVYTIDSKGTIQVLNTKNGLPSNNNNFVFNANNKVAIGTDVGFYEWNYKNPKTVISSNEFNILNRKVIILNAKQINNSIWFTEVNPNNEIRAENINKISYSKNSYFENKNYLIRLSGIRAKSFYSDSSFVYLSTNQGLYCCDESNYTFKCQFSVIINKLIFGINTDTTYTLENYASKFQNYFHELPYKYNQLHITPTATSFYGDEKLQFSYYLEGRDTSYSDWRKNESIDYSDLKEGVYTFHIKAKDNIGSVSESVSITFTILPPWYRTTWAYIIYVILSITAFIISLRLYNKHLIADNLKLEKTIQDRTKTIVHQKQELESKNQEITDSINYAKRIQLSILPNVDEIKSAWKELFIFYQPKDIVSGDFYWFKKINETEFLLACADCTGHGVPGGFMSMICSSALKDASRISHKPSEILFHANNFVKDSLAQGNIEGGSKDGMEISLLLININSKQITYSGANRFLWILKKDALEIIDIKPTKGSIGSTTDYNFNYEEQVFVLSEGDQLYLSTDGFPDQFGGEEEKKFMTKNLKKLIINNAKSNIHDQHNIYKDTINAWMKNTDQVDDILVIGIKF